MGIGRIIAVAAAIVGLSAVSASAEVLSAQGFGSSQATACQSAKNNAAVRTGGAKITGYGQCLCSNDGSGSTMQWACTVDVYFTRD